MFEIIAEVASTVSPESIPVWAQIVGGTSSLGVTSWLVYYNTKYTIPRLQKQHADAMNKQSLDHSVAMNKQAEIHSEIVEKYATTIDNLVAEFRKESQEQRAESQDRLDRSYDLVMASTAAVNSVANAVERLTDHVNQIIHPGAKSGAPLSSEMSARPKRQMC